MRCELKSRALAGRRAARAAPAPGRRDQRDSLRPRPSHGAGRVHRAAQHGPRGRRSLGLADRRGGRLTPFPAGASIAAGGFLVVTQNAADFQAKYGFAPFGQWETGDKLSNEGETIELRDAANALVDTVTYKLGFPWPTTGDFGSSLELINPALDNDLGGSWRSSGLSANPNAGAMLVASGSTWRYRKGITANPPTVAGNPAMNWRLTGFVEANDSVAWQNGVDVDRLRRRRRRDRARRTC